MEFKIGIDIVEHDRVKSQFTEKFIARILSEKEFNIYSKLTGEKRKIEYLASRFASKEAVFKALEEGDKTLNYKDISILNKENGAPFVICSKYNFDFKISISHSSNYSIVQVLLIK